MNTSAIKSAHVTEVPTSTPVDPASQAQVQSILGVVERNRSQNEKSATVRKKKKSRNSPRGPGRPRADGRPNQSTLKKWGVSDPNPLEGVVNEQGTVSAQVTGTTEVIERETTGIPMEALESVAAMPFSVIAAATGYDTFDLTQAEAKNIAPLIDQCMAHYFPQVKSEHAPALALALTVGFALAPRTIGYLRFRRAKEVENEVNAPKAAVIPSRDPARSPVSPVEPAPEPVTGTEPPRGFDPYSLRGL